MDRLQKKYIVNSFTTNNELGLSLFYGRVNRSCKSGQSGRQFERCMDSYYQ